jgi:ATP-dependent helicase/nuclease subunit B
VAVDVTARRHTHPLDSALVGLRTEWVAYGRPAAETLRGEIADAKGGDPLAPVTVIVPSNHVGVAARRLLASGKLGPVCDQGTGVAAVTFLTVYRLGELLGAARLAADGRRPVSTPVIGAAFRTALADRPGVFGPVATHPATELALVTAYRELRDLTPAALESLRGQSRRAADVVRLHGEVRRALEPSWYDEEDLLDAAADALDDGHPLASELGRVVVHLPERVSLHGAALLRALADRERVVIVAGTTGDLRADAETIRSVERLGGVPEGPVQQVDPQHVVGPSRTRILTVSDSDEEVRAAVRAVVDAVRSGTPLDRVALLFADPEPYARLAHEQLRAARVVVNGTALMPLRARVAGRTLLGLLALAEGGDGGFRRDELFAWLGGARIHHDGRWAPVAAWERLSREAGVVEGRRQWDQLLTRLADEREAEADERAKDPEAPEWRIERSRTEAGRARALRTFVLGLVDDLAAAGSDERPWRAWADWAGRHLRQLLGGEQARAGWPLVEQRAAERVERALDRLACLGEIEGPVSLDVFGRTLELELDADLGRVGRMGEGVFVGPVSMGVGLDLDLVVLLGLAEGVFPSPTRDDSLLPDRERVAASGELPLRAGLVDRRHREFLAALAGSPRQVLCVPRGDLRGGRERVPSRWVLSAAGALAGSVWRSEDLLDPHRDEPWLEHVASFDSGLRAVEFPASDQEYRLRSLLAARAPRGAAPFPSSPDPRYTAGSAVIEARRSRRFTRFDGNLSGLSVPSPADRVMSATRLEGWATCPFAYFARNILGVEEVENPEEELAITPLTRGSLVHEVLEEFVRDVLARPAAAQPGPSQPWTAADRDRMVAIAERHCKEFEEQGRTGRPVFWRRDKPRIIDDLLHVLDLDSEHRAANGTRPVAAELSFGFDNSPVGTVSIPLPDGRAVTFHGLADRVDVADDGTIHVVDYKTGSDRSYRELSEDSPDLGGTKLQLPVYGQAARALLETPDAPVRAEYWFTSSKGGFGRIGYEVTPEVLERVGSTLAVVVEGIENGVFPHYPTASSTTPFVECAYCDPDALGVAGLRRAWERKADDPDLEPFHACLGLDEEDGPDA